MTILDTILAEKKREVTRLHQQPMEPLAHPPLKNTFRQRIKKSNHMGVIAEIKRASPSKGTINANVDPAEQAKKYEQNGASAISVLTDTPFFKGTMDDLKAVREVVDIPILCKDFIIDSIQIDHAKAAGANIILLIAAALHDEKLKQLYTYALEQNLEVLCEVHNEEEMERAMKLGATIIGINNRNLKTFHVDLETTSRLANMVTNPDTILISESGIETRKDVETVAQAGAQVILVGETLMRTNSIDTTMKELQIRLHNNTEGSYDH